MTCHQNNETNQTAQLSVAARHQVLFERYTTHTDGKEKLAESIRGIIAKRNYKRVYDFGAGDGKLTALFADCAERVTAIERNKDYLGRLEKIPNVEVIITAMENARLEPGIDLALLSYSLSGVPKDRLRSFLGSILDCLTPQGSCLFVTFDDACDWSKFVGIVYPVLGVRPTGGANLHRQELEALGFKVSLVRSVPTLIWGDSLRDLAQVLGFFFIKNLDSYLENAASFLPELERLITVQPDGRHAIAVNEQIFEITR